MSPDPTTHLGEDVLVDLATGAPVAPATEAHVAFCSRCAAEVEALRDVVELARTPTPELVEPPARVWDAVAAELDAGSDPVPDPATDDEREEVATVTAMPVDGPRHGRPGSRTPGRRVAPAWLAAASAAGVLVGGGTVVALDRSDPESGPAPVVVARATLDTLDPAGAFGSASAVRVDGALDLDVEHAAVDSDEGYLEVWLINRDGTRMVSVGVLRPEDGTQRFPIDQRLIDAGYVVVDISREGFDDRPEHSGDSVARGTLEL